MELFLSVIQLYIFISFIEFLINKQKTPFIFFFGGIFGTLFSAIINQTVFSNGAFPGFFAILGGSIGFLIFNWKNLDYENSPRFIFCCYIGMISLFFFLGNSAGGMGSLFGLMGGIFCGLWISDRHQGPN